MHLVTIEFRRIQTFLFSSRRLRDMVGANVLLGELIRRDLPQLAQSFPGATVDLSSIAEVPEARPDDPLGSGLDAEDIDDPRALYRRGILARDGGHLRLVFRENADALNFIAAAESLITDRLPGLLFDIDRFDLERLPRKGSEAKPPREIAPVEAPVFLSCEATGLGAAASSYRFYDEGGREVGEENISEGVVKRRKAYDRFHEGKPTHDVIGLLAAMRKDRSPPPEDFEALCGGDYLAVIHADGNDIGKKAMHHARHEEPSDLASFIEREAHLEHFFHANRVSFRCAVRDAVEKTFPQGGVPQQQLLMLGGDDLLVACRAKLAFPFALALARALESDSAAPTVGVGIAIAARTVPFHHLQQVAEELTKSAKRLYRRLAEDRVPASVIDWKVETGSWSLDPMAARQSDLIRVSRIGETEECFVLSRRPLPILSSGESGMADHDSLEGIIAAADAIGRLVESPEDKKVARSQLRDLVQALEHGRRWSEYAYAAAPASLRERLAETPQIGLTELWQGGDGAWSTALRDIVEIFEISRLGVAPRDEPAAA